MTVAIDIAKAVRIEDEIARRGIKLIGRGPERYGPCPLCGGTDRFSINAKKGVWNCRGCGKGGDIISLVQFLDGANFQDAVRTLAGDEPRPIIRPAPKAVAPQDDDATNTKRALKLWQEGSPIGGTLAEEYLRRRGLKFHDPDGDVLRFYGGCPFDGTSYPCLLALFRNIVTNEPKAINRTAIPCGMKLGKALSLGPTRGCAVKLDRDENIERGLVIAEGVETALAARQLGFRPCWAVGSAGAIRSFPVLAGIEALTILVDNDEPDCNGRRAGPDAAAECSSRWRAAGGEVRRIVPRLLGKDMADLAEAPHD